MEHFSTFTRRWVPISNLGKFGLSSILPGHHSLLDLGDKLVKVSEFISSGLEQLARQGIHSWLELYHYLFRCLPTAASTTYQTVVMLTGVLTLVACHIMWLSREGEGIESQRMMDKLITLK